MEKIVSMNIKGNRIVYGDTAQAPGENFEFRGTVDADGTFEIQNVTDYDLLVKHCKIEGIADPVDGFYVWVKGATISTLATAGARYFIEATAV